MIEYKVGGEEHVAGTIRASVPLDEQQVEVTLDGGTTWLAAEWIGPVGLRRDFRTTAPVPFTTPKRGRAVARVTDNSETIPIELGEYKVTPL